MPGMNKDPKSTSEHINLTVLGTDGTEVQFQMKKDTPMSKLMDGYCARKGLAPDAIRFQFDGQPLKPLANSTLHEMVDGDIIEIFQEHTGG